MAHGFPSHHAIVRIIDSLGAALFPLRLGPAELTPDSEDAVVRAALESALYASATILGRITIGKGSVVGGNVWLTSSILAGSRVLRTKKGPAPKDRPFESLGEDAFRRQAPNRVHHSDVQTKNPA